MTPLGFSQKKSFQAGERGKVRTGKLLDMFRPTHLFVASDVAGAFLVHEIGILSSSGAYRSLNIAKDLAIPARMFTEFSKMNGWNMEGADPGDRYVADVTNLSGATTRFQAAIYGGRGGSY